MHWINKKQIAIYSSANLIWQLSSLVSEILILRIISPELVGVWQFGILVKSYLMFMRLGLINAMNIELPTVLALNKENDAKYIRNSIFSYYVCLSILVIIVTIPLLYFAKNNWRILTITIAILFVIEIFSNFYEAILRSEKKFEKISKSYLLTTPFLFLFLLLPWKYGFLGLCIRYVLIELSKYSILYSMLQVKFTFQIKKNIFKNLFSIAWKIWLWSYIKNFSKSMPKLALVYFGNTTLLGLYAPVNWVQMGFMNLVSSISSYMYPSLTRELALKNEAASLDTLKICIKIFLGFIPLMVILYFIIPIGVVNFITEYTESITAIQIGLVAGFTEILTVPAAILTAKKEWKSMYRYISILIFCKAILLLIFIFIFPNNLVLAVSIGTLASVILAVGLLVFFLFPKVIWKFLKNDYKRE